MNDWELLSAYVDAESSPQENALADQRLMHEPSLRLMLQELQSQKSACGFLKPVLNHEEPWQRCVARLNELDEANRTHGFISRYAWAFCSALIFIIAIAGGWQRLSNSAKGGSESSQYVAQVMAGFVPDRRANAAPEDVKRWVQGVFDLAGAVNDENYIRVIGNEFGVFDGHRVERHFLEDASGPLVLVAVEGQVPLEGMQPATEDGTYHVGKMGLATCIAWHKPNYTVFLMGERPASSLTASAQRMCRSLQ
jgi:hypothetical protein